MKRATLLAAAMALLAAGLLAGSPAQAVSQPPPVFGDVALNDVIARTATDAWAVGDGGLASHWDGSSWTSQHLGGNYSPDLNGVDATTGITSRVWVVGGVVVQDQSRGFASWWSGTWHRTPVPRFPGEVILEDVAAQGRNAWAVGRWFSTTPAGHAGGAVILYWGGRKWHAVSGPGGVASLEAATLLAGGHLLAVGRAAGTGVPVAVRGTVGAWTATRLPTPPGARCVAHDVDGLPAVVVGTCRPVSAVVPTHPYVVDRRSNGTWKLQIVPGHNSELWGVDAEAATWAVGGRGTALVLRRRPDGSWFRVAQPALRNGGSLLAVDASTFSQAWSVGWRLIGGVKRPLALQWNGTSWTAFRVPLA